MNFAIGGSGGGMTPPSAAVDDDAKLLAEQARADKLNGYLGAAGSVLDNFADVPSAHEMLFGRKSYRSKPSEAFKSASGAIKDPMETKRKAMEYMKLKRESAQATAADSIASPEMVSFYEGVVPSMKGRFDKMTQGQIDKVSPVLMAQFRAQGDERMARMAAEQRGADKAEAVKSQKEAKDEALRVKTEERDLTLAVPGYERTGEVLPKAEEAVKFRKATATANSLSQKLNRMKELVTKYGSFEYGGDGYAEMEPLATEIQLLGKSPELYELGVLTGPDMSLLQKITSDPTSLNSLFTKDTSRQKQIDTQLTGLQNKIRTTASSLGYRQAGAVAQSAPSAPSTSPQKLLEQELAQQEIARRQAAKNTAAN